MKLKKGDNVKVVKGKDKGKTGLIESVDVKHNKVLVAGVNMYKKHMKSRGKGQEAGIKDITKPLTVANVVLICPKCNLNVRVGYSIKDNKKIRICRKCEQEV